MYVFRDGKSIQETVLQLSNVVYEASKASKAFDRVNLSLLLSILENIEIRGNAYLQYSTIFRTSIV